MVPKSPRQSNDGGITDVAGIRVGHFTLSERPTGCTVLITERGAVAGVDVRGSAPGTRETDLLDPVKTVQEVHAVMLSGGSAFGLDAASGAVRYLSEHGIGFPMGGSHVPIVPAAVIFDLGVGDSTIRPDAEAGYAACEAADTESVAEGNVGAGTGATVGKMLGSSRAMKGGLGTASIQIDPDVVVGAIVAVNCVGDVVDPATGRIVAGARNADGKGFADMRKVIRAGGRSRGEEGNTTIGIVATNARFNQAQMTKVAQMAQDALARTIYPAHTPFDGDTVFALSTGTTDTEANLGTIGALAAEALAEAILRGVKRATSIPGYPAYRDLVDR